MDLPIDIMSQDEDNDSLIGRDSVFKKPTQVGNSETKLLDTDASDGVPLTVPKKWPQQSTILAQLEGATFENIAHHAGALGRLRVDGQNIILDINGERYTGPLCSTVSCLVVNMTKGEGKITSVVSDYCPLSHERNVLGNVRGKLTRGELEEEEEDEAHDSSRKRNWTSVLARAAQGPRRKQRGRKKQIPPNLDPESRAAFVHASLTRIKCEYK